MKFHRLHDSAQLPTKANVGDAGYDLTAVAIKHDYESGYIEIDTGIAVEIPPNHVGLLCARSSVSNTSLILSNSVGIIDSGYRGSLKMRFKPLMSGKRDRPKNYKVGDRVGQLIVVPVVASTPFWGEMSTSERGQNGFGSSGE